jgi:hypothetical protein
MDKVCDKDDGFACPMTLISISGHINNEEKYDLYQCFTCGLLLKYNISDSGEAISRTFIKSDDTVIKR